MKIKFLSFIASFFLVSFVMTSCLDNDDNTEYSPDATIRAFELDTIGGYGVSYKFTIDQVERMIYNVDSLPVHADTIINRILIKTLTTASGIVTMKDQNDQDSIINISDSLDLTKYVNAPKEGKYLTLKVWAPNMAVQNEYKVSIRMHHQVPDSLHWGSKPIADNPVTTTERQKLVTLDNKILLFTDNSNEVYTVTIPEGSTPTNPLNYGENGDWDRGIATLPEGADITSLIRFMNKLYMTANGEVFNSEDGLTWTRDANLSVSEAQVTHLITSFSDIDGSNNRNIEGIAAIIEKDGQKKFYFYDTEKTTWEEGMDVPNNFPLDNLSADVYPTESGILTAIIVGNTQGIESETNTLVWSSEDGKSWYTLNENSTINCPKLIDPSIIHYNGSFYICGKEANENGDINVFQKFYTSKTLLVWNGTENLFMLPGTFAPIIEGGTITYPSSRYGFKGKDANYSIVVDKNHFIWMVGGDAANNDGNSDAINKIWRGRVNKLGFLIQ